MQIVGLERLDRSTRPSSEPIAAPFPTPADRKGAIEFPLDLALGAHPRFRPRGRPRRAGHKAKPAMLIEGMLDRAILPALALADFAGVWPKAPVIEVPTAGHYIQEDAPEIVIPAIQTFLAMLQSEPAGATATAAMPRTARRRR